MKFSENSSDNNPKAAFDKDVKGVIAFIILFLSICLSALIILPIVFGFDFHINDPVGGLFFYTSIIFGYAIIQLIMVYFLAVKTLRNTKNKYLAKIFTSRKTSLIILLVLILFDITVNLIVKNLFDLSDYENHSIKFGLFMYNLYLAPSV